ncbi:MAG: hypothetical protein LQ341_003311 [Variospora aurantia]|nr:MAG: hypothetical protein LQ341_003311 [Variospora aurantia]
MSVGQLARQRSSSSSSRPQIRATTPVTPFRSDQDFEPCAATASIFLYAQGSSIICLHHDTLAIDRRFELHKERILFLSVDNVSERGAGRLVVSYDAGQTAIVWDLFTGDEIARFASYEPIKVAAWMKNGNVAFGISHFIRRERMGVDCILGNSQGSVILFEPSTSEHISARTIFDPITAIAPAADCQTYAIGYLNGSVLLVSLRPAFTILHTLPIPRAPSPIVTLAWHASSTKQKSDMLAIQTADGDLRVWSVAKPPTAEPPRVIRVLKRLDTVESGPNWIAWSKNGRIIQYAEGETWSWDVRTKHVSCEPIPTIAGVRGLANYGPTAALFTVGPNYTVQQYDMNPPAMTKSVQYFPMGPPPVPAKVPTTASQKTLHSIPGTAPPVADPHGSETSRGPVNLSTIQRSANQMQAIEHAQQARSDISSPASSRSMTESMSSRSSTNAAYPYQRTQASYSSRAASGTTFSTIPPSMLGHDSFFSGGSSVFPQTNSRASTGRRSRGSRLRQEVLRSPESKYVDLFPRTRARLSTVQYKPHRTLDQENSNADDLRRQMLDVVFDWEDDIEPLIRDELAHHQPGSTSAVLLAKWLGEVDTDQMAAIISSGNVNSADWMMLALSSMGGQSGKMGQAFVQRLLQQGDFHTSATILLGMGDREDAVEVYVSRSFFMEAILLTCLIFPTDWQRQAHLVRRWGEFVVENSQQQLAIRCFQCTGVEPPMPWASPSLHGQSTPSQASQSVISMLSPPISPPPQPMKPQAPGRMTTKNSSLKLITSFGPPDKTQFKFPGLKSEDRTPTQGPGVTPIAESAISPNATPGGFLRPSSRNKGFNRAMTPGGHRNRLPSIGETPVDSSMPLFPRPSKLPTPNDSGSDVEKERFLGAHAQEGKSEKKTESEPLLLLSSARYEPSSAVSGKSPMTALPNRSIEDVLLPDPAADAFTAFREREASKKRSVSKDRKPDGLHIRMPSNQDQGAFASSAENTSNGFGSHQSYPHSGSHTNNSTSGRLDARSDVRSPPLSGQSWASAKSPSASGRSTDQFISSLDEAGYHSRRSKDATGRRHKSREGREHKPRSKHRTKDHSEDRGRNHQKYIRPAKRSPSSPVPMTPDDLHQCSGNAGPDSTDGQPSESRTPGMESRHGRDHSQHSKHVSKLRSGSKASDYSSRTVRHISPDGYLDSQLGSETSNAPSKASSRRVSPRAFLDLSGRGRSKSKGDGSTVRSPSSPLPLADQVKSFPRSEDEDESLRIVEANRHRLRSAHRSSSRRAMERGTSAHRDSSPDRRRQKSSRHRRSGNEAAREPQSAIEPRMTTDEMFAVGADGYRESFERLQRKELAARELEARRESLARRPEVPEIPHPTDLYSPRPPIGMRSQTDLSNSPASWGGNPNVPQQQLRLPSTAFNPREANHGAASVGPYGLPATPKAMRHPRYNSKDENGIPEVPEIPDTLAPPNETYATGQPLMELPRSMSAPIPQEQPPPPPTMLPVHPAIHKGLRTGHKNSTFLPLGEIGQHRRRPSIDSHPPVLGIEEALSAADSTVQITTIEQPPLLPELQHLSRGNSMAVPPPPPPPPPPAFPSDSSHHSASSSSGLGVINIAIDEQPGEHVIEVPPSLDSRTRSPPPMTAKSPQAGVVRTGSGHRRGRSDQFKNGIKGFTERLRSTSRGRNNTKSPLNEQVSNTPSPYESVPPLYF